MVIIAGHLLVEEAERDNYVAAHRDLVSRAPTFDGCTVSGSGPSSRTATVCSKWADREPSRVATAHPSGRWT